MEVAYVAYLKYATRSVILRPGGVTMNAVPPAPHYTSYTEARTHLKDLLDASARNQLPTVQRDNELHIVVSADRMRRILEQANPSRAQSEAQSHGGWAMFTAHPPLAVEGAAFE